MSHFGHVRYFQGTLASLMSHFGHVQYFQYMLVSLLLFSGYNVNRVYLVQNIHITLTDKHAYLYNKMMHTHVIMSSTQSMDNKKGNNTFLMSIVIYKLCLVLPSLISLVVF